MLAVDAESSITWRWSLLSRLRPSCKATPRKSLCSRSHLYWAIWNTKCTYGTQGITNTWTFDQCMSFFLCIREIGYERERGRDYKFSMRVGSSVLSDSTAMRSTPNAQQMSNSTENCCIELRPAGSRVWALWSFLGCQAVFLNQQINLNSWGTPVKADNGKDCLVAMTFEPRHPLVALQYRLFRLVVYRLWY